MYHLIINSGLVYILSHMGTKNVLLLDCLEIRFAALFHYYSSKQLLDDLKEKRRYWKLTEEALDRTLWRTRFGRGYGPVTRPQNELNE
jgi:hypothetical protein